MTHFAERLLDFLMLKTTMLKQINNENKNGGKEKTGVVLLAAGAGTRFGKDKIFFELAGKPVIAWSLDVFEKFPFVSEIVLVFNKDNMKKARAFLKERNYKKISAVCIGGKRRQDSVYNGLKNAGDWKYVIIHDGARPFIDEEIILRGMEETKKTGAAIAAVPVKDTIKIVNPENLIEHTLERDRLWAVQTPQIFDYETILKAHEMNKNVNVTDDASMLERAGFSVKIFLGSYNNIKITTPEDIEIGKSIASKLIRG